MKGYWKSEKRVPKWSRVLRYIAPHRAACTLGPRRRVDVQPTPPGAWATRAIIWMPPSPSIVACTPEQPARVFTHVATSARVAPEPVRSPERVCEEDEEDEDDEEHGVSFGN